MQVPRKATKTCIWYPVCPMKRFYEEGKISESWVANYCWVSNPECVRKKLEDAGVYHPDNMLPDGTIDKSLK